MELLKIKLLVDKKVVQETTNRIGISNKRDKILYPSCYVYEQDGEFYLAHFKQLFEMRDNGYSDMNEDDIHRRNAVAFCLKSWGLIDVVNDDIEPHDTYVFVLPHKAKRYWTIKHKIKYRVNTFTLNS